MRITRHILSSLLALLLLFALVGCDLLQGKGAPADNTEFTPTVFTEVLKTEFESCYGDQLSPNERHIYDKILALAPGELTVEISFPEVPTLCRGREPTKEETDALGERISAWAANALYAVWLDMPEIFWINYAAYSYSYEMKSDESGVVSLTKLTLSLSSPEGVTDPAGTTAALLAATADFFPKGNTISEKVTYINRYLCERITYDLDAPNRGNVVGALLDGRCVCEGYAQAFAYLAKRAGIRAFSIPGYAYTDEKPEGEGHMWSAVPIDGVLYAVDVTWNDTTGRDSYLLIGAKTVCHGMRFEESHRPNMLTLDGPHKAFAFPKIGNAAYSPKFK